MPKQEFVTFYLGKQLFGLDIQLVREINKQLDLTAVPHADDYIRGLINLRGQIVTVFDLKQRLQVGCSKITENSHNIILKSNAELAAIAGGRGLATCNDKVGLLVDDIGDIITTEDCDIEQPPANIGKIDGRYCSGVVKLNRELMGVLSAEKILEN